MPRRSVVSVAVVATVRDEAASIDGLLASLRAGTRQPDEIVIVDAGSRDGTWQKLAAWATNEPRLRVISLPGCGRSEGRNVAIAATTAPWIAVTDGGVRLDARWLAALMAPVEGGGKPATKVAPTTSEVGLRRLSGAKSVAFRVGLAPVLARVGGLRSLPGATSVAGPSKPDVVAGFFRPDPATPFERALGATTLPRQRDIRPDRFLPSSRSIAFSRAAWQAAGGYPEWLDYGEDLVFDLKLRRAGARFAFAPEAIAYFRPRSNSRAFFRQYFCYARGDGKALLWPRRHAIRYASYGALTALLLRAVARRDRPAGRLAALALLLGAAAYLRTPVQRLHRPDDPAQQPATLGEWLVLPALLPWLRLVGDVAKMLGYPLGRFWRWQHALALPPDPTAPAAPLCRAEQVESTP